MIVIKKLEAVKTEATVGNSSFVHFVCVPFTRKFQKDRLERDW